MYSSHGKKTLSVLLVLCLAVFLFSFLGCGEKDLKSEFKATEYQAVFLSSGHVLFGKIDKYTPNYVLLTDVYQAQSRATGDKEVTNFIVGRAQQYHTPNMTWIQPSSIVMIEPVAVDSKAAKMIKEAKEKEKK